MLKYSVSIGLQDMITRREYDKAEVVDAIAAMFADSGCSIMYSLGVYKYEDGTQCREQSLVAVVYGDERLRRRVIGAADTLKRQFRQESVIVTIEPAPETLWI